MEKMLALKDIANTKLIESKVLRRVLSIALVLLLILPLLFLGQKATKGASLFAEWTTKGDFESNAATTGTATTRSQLKATGASATDDADVTLIGWNLGTISTPTTSTLSTATAENSQRKVVKTSSGKLVWFYSDGTNIVYRTSDSPYTSWSTATSLGFNAASFSVDIDSSDNIHISYSVRYYRKLTYSAPSTWTPGAAVVLPYDSDAGGGSGISPFISNQSTMVVSSTKLFVGWQNGWTNTDNGIITYWPNVSWSTDLNGTSWSTRTLYQVQDSDPGIPQLATYNSGSKVAAFYQNNSGGQLVWRNSDIATVSLTSWAAQSAINAAAVSGSPTAVGEGANIHLAVNSSTGIKYIKYNGTSWDSSYTSVSSGASDVYPSISFNGSNILIFYSKYVAANQYNIVYRSDSNWATENSITTDNLNNRYPTAIKDDASVIPVFWTTGTTSPYSLKYNRMIIGNSPPYLSPGTIGAGTGVGLRATTPDGESARWSTLKFNYEPLVSGQNVQFQIRTADTTGALSSATYKGPDGTSSTWFDSSTTGATTITETNSSKTTTVSLPSSITPSKHTEIQVKLTSDGSNTPALHSVRLEYDTIDAPGASNLSLYRSDGTTQISVPDSNGGWTNETSVKVKVANMQGLSDSTTLTPEVEAKPFGTAFDGTGTTEGSALVPGSTGEVTLSSLSNNTAYHARVRLKDNLNRVSGWTNFNNDNKAFTIEQTVPTGSLTIKDAATNSTSYVTSGGTNNATLDLSTATDPGTPASGVDKVMASEDSSFTGASWQNYSASLPFTLSGDGSKTLYVRFKDKAGNVGPMGDVIVTKQPSSADTYLEQQFPDSNNGTLAAFTVKSYTSANTRAILKFDFSADIPAGATINSALLSLYAYSVNNTSGRTYWAYRLTQTNWTESGATWNKYDGINNWTTAGGDYTTTDGTSSTVPSANNWQNWTATAQVQYAVNNTGRVAHLLLKDGVENEATSSYTYYRSKEYTTDPALQPKLVINYVGLSSASDSIILDTTRPANVSGLVGKDQNGGSITLTSGNWYNYFQASTKPYFSWAANTDSDLDATNPYKVYFGTNGSATAQANGSFQTAISFSPSTLTDPSVNYLKVAAKDNAGNYSLNDANFTYKYDNTAPVISTSTVTASTTDSAKVAVSWTKPTDNADAIPGGGAVSYDVYRKLSTAADVDGSYTKLNTNPVSTLSYDDTTTDANYMYNYKIKATDAAGNLSGFSSKSNDGYLQDTIAPSMPSSPVATAQSNGTSIVLTWGQSLDNVAVKAYKIYRTTVGTDPLAPDNPTSTYQLVVDTISEASPTATSYTNTGLVDNKRYYYRIQAYDTATPANKSSFSENGVIPPTATAITPDVTAPNAPGWITTNGANGYSANRNDIDWNKPQDLSNDGTTAGTGSSSYRVYRSTNSYDGNAYSGVSDLPAATFGAITATVNSTASTVSYSDTPLSSYTWYAYKLVALDVSSNISSDSSIIWVRTRKDTQPVGVSNVTLSTPTTGDPATDSTIGYRITISFTGGASKNDTLDKYEIYRSTSSSGPWTDLRKTFTATDMAPVTSGLISSVNYSDKDTASTYSYNDDTGLNDNTTYYYKIRVVDTIASGPDAGTYESWTDTASSITTKDVTAPADPDSISVVDLYPKGTISSILGHPILVVSWSHISARVGHPTGTTDDTFTEYRLYRSTDGLNWGNAITPSGFTDNYYIDEAVSSNTTYYYKVATADGTVHDLGGQTINNESTGVVSSPVNPSAIDKVAPAVVFGSAGAGVNSATVGFSTNESARVYIEYGKTTDYNSTAGTPGYRTSHSISLANLEPNTGYNYRIVASDANGNKVTGSNRTFQTDKFSASNINVTTSVSSATVSWKTNEEGDSFVKYGLSSTNEKVAGSDEISKNHSVTVSNLKPSTIYKFKVKSKDAYNNIVIKSDGDNTFQTKPFRVANITTLTSTNSASIRWNTNVSATSLVEYKGPDDSVSQVAGDANLTKEHKVDIKNLKTSTVYSFRLKSRDKDDNVAESSILSFRTKSLSEGYDVNPQVSKLNELELTTTNAKISWTTEGETSSWVEYGTSKSLGKLAGNDTLTVDHIITLEGLTPGTTYYYRVKGEDVDGNAYQSSIYSFTALVEPKITSKPKVSVTNDSATISWTTNTDTDSIIEYGLTNKYGDSTGSGVLAKEHSLTIVNLSQDTTSHFRVGGVDKFSNKVMSDDFSFKTKKDTTGPTISDIRNEILRSTDEAGKEKISVIVNFTTDEEATSYIEYAEGISMASYNKKSRQNNTLNLSHSVMIENLNPSTTYHYRVVTKDKYGNETKSEDKTLLTPKESESILQKIIRTLEETFSWVNNLRDYLSGKGK